MFKLLVFLLCIPLTAWAGVLTGTVVKVSDGDTITVLVQDCRTTTERVRLLGIDCPETKQAFGHESRALMSQLVMGQAVTVRTTKRDGYGRWLGEVFVDGLHVNQEMVRVGACWFYAAYSHDPALAELEAGARAAKVGLWAQDEPIAPWIFRKLR